MARAVLTMPVSWDLIVNACGRERSPLCRGSIREKDADPQRRRAGANQNQQSHSIGLWGGCPGATSVPRMAGAPFAYLSDGVGGLWGSRQQTNKQKQQTHT